MLFQLTHTDARANQPFIQHTTTIRRSTKTKLFRLTRNAWIKRAIMKIFWRNVIAQLCINVVQVWAPGTRHNWPWPWPWHGHRLLRNEHHQYQWIFHPEGLHILAAYHVLSLSFRISILLTYAMGYKEQRGHCGDRTKYFGLYFIGLGCDGVMIGLHPGLWRSDIGWHMDDKYETNMTTAMTAGSGQWGNWIRGCGRALREEGHINNGISGICVKLYKRNISDIFV